MTFAKMHALFLGAVMLATALVAGPSLGQTWDRVTPTKGAEVQAPPGDPGAQQEPPSPPSVKTELVRPQCELADPSLPIALDRTAIFRVLKLACPGGAASKALWLNGMDSGVRSLGCDEAQGTVSFNVSRSVPSPTTATREVWLTLLRDPFSVPGEGFFREVTVTLRDETTHSLIPCGKAGKEKFEILDAKWAWVGATMVALVFAGLITAALRTNLLRDSGPLSNPENRPPYSLARLQMAWWFAIVFASYVGLWLVGHSLPSIPAVVLGLIGISAGTTLVAGSIDGEASKLLRPTEGLWRDISTDPKGQVTVYRFQQIAWTILFGIVFAHEVLMKQAMPDFDGSVLVLMGVSAAAYLGAKLPESKPPSPPSEQSGADGATPDDPKAGYRVSP